MAKRILTLFMLALAPIVSRAQTISPDQPVLQLSLKQAVDMALAPDGSLRIQLAEELVQQAHTRSAQSRAALLPNLDASVGQQNRVLNLAANGIRFNQLIPIPGLTIPKLVGPLNTFDARTTLSQSIFDLSSIRRFQAARMNVNVAASESESSQDQVAGQVAKSYLSALRAEASRQAIQANVTLAETLLQVATNQKAAGTGMAIDVTRARVQLSNERQRLLVTENERKQAHLELLRAIRLPLGRTLELTDKFTFTPGEPPSVERALAIALEARADYKAQRQREESAQLSYRATRSERWPSVVGFADYGSTGLSINNAVPTRTYGFSVRQPVFDGGRRDARRAESLSQFHQEHIKTEDLRQQIELEIRLALDSLRSAEEQVKVAEEGLELSQSELAQARRRYQAGVAPSLEVTDAQTRLVRSRDNQVAALYNYNLARINLEQAMGTIRRWIK